MAVDSFLLSLFIKRVWSFALKDEAYSFDPEALDVTRVSQLPGGKERIERRNEQWLVHVFKSSQVL